MRGAWAAAVAVIVGMLGGCFDGTEGEPAEGRADASATDASTTDGGAATDGGAEDEDECARMCEDSPEPECVDDSTLRVFDEPGRCRADGGCDYDSRTVDCPSCPACDACASVTCDDPPEAQCVDDTTLRTYSAPGSCEVGTCEYPHTEMSCELGCSGGSCNDPSDLAQRAYLKASNTEMRDEFGASVAISGDTLVVGAHYEDSAATGVNGEQSDNSASSAGAVYVFQRSGGSWSQQAYLKASNTDGGDAFGRSVAIADETIVVGAPNEASAATGVDGDASDNSAERAGAAYVFERSGGSWSQQAYLKASNTDGGDAFGNRVSIAGDTILVGAPDEASAATGVDGDAADDSAERAGAAYVFERSGGSWSQQAYLKASNTDEGDTFGYRVSIAGDRAVVSAPRESSAAAGVGGDQADNSVDQAGAAYVFVRNGSSWSQQAYLKASNPDELDGFGENVAISGDTVVVGAFEESSAATGVNGNASDNSADGAGAVYVFERAGGSWSHQAYLKASNTDEWDGFGYAVALSSDTLVVSALYEDSAATGVNGDESSELASSSGAAYVFERAGGSWSQQAYLKASNTDRDDWFGEGVALSDDTAVISTPNETSAATGVNGDQADNSTDYAGAAYVFGGL
jgi:hypothetical protein